MQLAQVSIRNFRAIEDRTIDFTDEFGRVRPITVLAGPNASGKTSILDAIACAICPATKMCWPRPNLRVSPAVIVRQGAAFADVEAKVRFDPVELETVRRLCDLASESSRVSDHQTVTLSWRYPDPKGEFAHGRQSYSVGRGWLAFEGRYRVTRLLYRPEVDFSWFERAGGVFTFDQERTLIGKQIPADIRAIITGELPESNGERRLVEDPRLLLLDLAVRGDVGEGEHAQQAKREWQTFKERHANICAPHRIIGPEPREVGLDMVFSDGEGRQYGIDGLSSGEQMVLLFLIRMVQEHIHRSIVLIDELELHQHPLWQRKLLQALPKMGDGNQFVVTTHSDYVRDIQPAEGRVVLGSLGD
jgi:energy-coupling factor transporter ATP-binding protein EcfA2